MHTCTGHVATALCARKWRCQMVEKHFLSKKRRNIFCQKKKETVSVSLPPHLLSLPPFSPSPLFMAGFLFNQYQRLFKYCYGSDVWGGGYIVREDALALISCSININFCSSTVIMIIWTNIVMYQRLFKYCYNDYMNKYCYISIYTIAPPPLTLSTLTKSDKEISYAMYVSESRICMG